MSVGPWTVFSEVVSTADADNDDLLKQKAVPSMESLFEGEISYYVETPVMVESDGVLLPWPLVFISEFTRETRPRAWKQTDLKLQSTLPILGADETAKEVTVEAGQALVRVSLILKQKTNEGGGTVSLAASEQSGSPFMREANPTANRSKDVM